MLNVQVKGVRHLQVNLSKSRLKLKRMSDVFRHIAAILARSFATNMTSGVDPDGKPLKPAAAWVRMLAGKNPSSRPLMVTGSLRRSIGPLSVTDSKLVFGFHGKYSRIALNQTNGTIGRVKLSEKVLSRLNKVKSGKSSKIKKSAAIGNSKSTRRKYVRAQIAPGKWITKPVIRGGYIEVNPTPRKFFFLGSSDVKKIRESVKKFLGTLFNA